MTLQETLREARYKHNANVEEWWNYADALEEKGVPDFKRIYCQICGHSFLDYSTSSSDLICQKFNGRVSPYDTCKYGVISTQMTDLIHRIV